MKIKIFLIVMIAFSQLAFSEEDNTFNEPDSYIKTLGSDGLDWRYVTSEPSSGWHLPIYDESNWQTGRGGFYVNPINNPRDSYTTSWNTENIWLRSSFNLSKNQIDNLMLWARWDDVIEVYINGVRAAGMGNLINYYRYIGISKAARDTLQPGINMIAVKVTNLGGEGFFDLALVDAPKLAKIPANGILGNKELDHLRQFAVEKMQQYGIPSGSIALTRSNRFLDGDLQVILSLGLGYLDKALSTPTQRDSVFRLASLDKGPGIEALKKLFIGTPIPHEIRDANNEILGIYWSCDDAIDDDWNSAIKNPVTKKLLKCSDRVLDILVHYGAVDRSRVLPGMELIRVVDVAYLQTGFTRGPNPHNEKEVNDFFEFLEIEPSASSYGAMLQWYFYSPLTKVPGTIAQYNNEDATVVRILVELLTGSLEYYLQEALLDGFQQNDIYVAHETVESRIRYADGSPKEPWYLAHVKPFLPTWLEDGLALAASAETFNAYKSKYGGGSNGGGMPGTTAYSREWGSLDGIHQYQLTWVINGEFMPLHDFTLELYNMVIDLDRSSRHSLSPSEMIDIKSKPIGPIQLVGTNFCFHPSGGAANPNDGVGVVLWDDCTEQQRISYSFTTASSIQHSSSGKCLHPAGGSHNPSNGTPLVFWDACDEDRLRFYWLSTGQIMHASSGKCVEAVRQNGSFANFSQLVLSQCSIVAAQNFTAPR